MMLVDEQATQKKKAHFSGRRVGATRRVCPEITRQVDLGQGQTDFSMKNKPTKFPLPERIELAKLAAILRRDPYSKPASALRSQWSSTLRQCVFAASYLQR